MFCHFIKPLQLIKISKQQLPLYVNRIILFNFSQMDVLFRDVSIMLLALALAGAVLASGASPAAAQNIGHFGKNRLRFATVEPSSLPDAIGTGIVDYKGGKEPTSQWRASFRFTGLEPGARYTGR